MPRYLYPVEGAEIKTKPRLGLVIHNWKVNLALEKYISGSDLFFGVLAGLALKKESGLEDHSHTGLIPDHITRSPPNPGF